MIILFLLILIVGVCLIAFTLSSGCVTAAKQIISPTPEPTPIPPETTAPTPTPTPTPVPTPDWTGCGFKDNCYQLRDWTHWFRENASGYQDLSTWATVYGYKVLPRYHFHDPMWGTQAQYLWAPAPGYEWLFIFVNIYSDGDDARQYGYDTSHFMIQVKDRLYYAEDPYHPENAIMELNEIWNYNHTESIKPYGFYIAQDLQTGIYTAKPMSQIYAGRSNAWDGWILYEVPAGTDLNEVKVAASFDNLGGNVWWKLT